MSGFVGILNLDGAPVGMATLDLMTRSMAFRGPDCLETWCEGAVGMGHAMLRATREAIAEHQPAALGGRLRIVADARIDARTELVREINAIPGPSREVSLATADPDLILHAYDVWGDSCVDHLLGDFSFAIWDQPQRRLFCARDHFGVKLLYYARIGNALVFSNTLDTLRLYPDFSPVLCDAAIADFLLIGLNLHPTLTPFEKILRLAPAHTLVVSADQVQIKRYWTFPIEEPIRYRRSRDYVDQCRELLHAAVSDRLRCDRASISLSGGLDSPTAAAVAAQQMGAPGNLLGINYGFKRLIPDREPAYARLVAEYLGMPFETIVIDDYKAFENWESPGLRNPYPSELALAAVGRDFMDRVARHGRVLLTGQGGDPGLAPSLTFYRGLGAFSLLWGVGKYTLIHGHHPRIGFRVTWQRWRGVEPRKTPNYPGWLDPELESRLGLRARWRDLIERRPSAHPFRPDSYNSLLEHHWSCLFESADVGYNYVPVETRHPLLDVRLQRFFLRLPVLPWCADKEILRVAMRDCLPESILRRAKCPLQENPMDAILAQANTAVMNNIVAVPELKRYVIQDRIPLVGAGDKENDPSIDLRPLNLNRWLRLTLY